MGTSADTATQGASKEGASKEGASKEGASKEGASTEGLRLAFDLYEAAEAIVRQNARRRMPEAAAEVVEAEVRAWLRKPVELPRSHFRPRRIAAR